MASIRKNENDIAMAMESLVVRSSLNAITSAAEWKILASARRKAHGNENAKYYSTAKKNGCLRFPPGVTMY
jgi:hypothetical protein